MATCKHLIIGAGPAALAAAQAIRNNDKTAAVKLVTREITLPYSPAVLPYLLSNEMSNNDLFAKGKNSLEAMNVQLVCGKEVVEVLHDSSEVKYATGERESYDKLLIATGAGPQIPRISNLETDQIYTFRTYADFDRLQTSLKEKQSIAIYGAGLVAVEVAEKLALAGYDVTIIARSSLLRKYFSLDSVAVLERAFAQRGTKIMTQSTLESVEKIDNQLVLHLSNGEKLTVDRLIIATGVSPNRVENSLFPVVEGGLQVGKYLETNLPNIYAAGDVAAAPSFYDGQNAPCPILPEAILQGRIAGANMSGGKVEYKGWIPGNYLRCFEENLFSIGITVPQDGGEYQILEKKESAAYLKLVFQGEHLVGVEGLNMKAVHPGVFLYLIREQVPVRKYQELLLLKPREAACWLMLQHRKSQEA
jgi:phenylglyoxylate dehydrogenase epsilon subunit